MPLRIVRSGLAAVVLTATLAMAMLAGCGDHTAFTYRRGLDHYQAQRYDRAFPLVREAAEAGNANAQAVLGVMYLYGRGTPADGALAQHWLLAAAKEGVTGAQSVLGIMYATGVGVARNEGEARHWLKLAAEAGDVEARVLLERMEAGSEARALATPAASGTARTAAPR